MKQLLWGLSFAVSALLIIATLFKWVDFSIWEDLGFITGGYSVWFDVKENIWTWPVSIANAIIFFILFMSSRLFADGSLQVIYFALNCFGWYWWLKGGAHKSKATISRAPAKLAAVFIPLTIVGTIGLYALLKSVHDIAPLWDGLSTILSLIAVYMLARKYFENWYVWLAVNAIYIGLYAIKHLPLLAILYIIYFVMTVIGIYDWKKKLAARSSSAKLKRPAGQEA